MLLLVGSTYSAVNEAAGTTCTVCVPLTLASCAVTVTVVAVVAVDAVPSPLLLIVSSDVLLELQVTLEVRFCVEPSLYVPVATNCCVLPPERLTFAGVTAIEARLDDVTSPLAVACIDS